MAADEFKYLKVRWIHDHPDEPVWIYSELDAEQWEVRKIEIYRDGTIGYAIGDIEVHGTGLSVEPWPPIEQIAADPQFSPVQISKREFEELWDTRDQERR